MLIKGTITTREEKVLIPLGKPPTISPRFIPDKNKKTRKPVTKWPDPFWFLPNSVVTLEKEEEEKGGRGRKEEKGEGDKKKEEEDKGERGFRFIFVIFE